MRIFNVSKLTHMFGKIFKLCFLFCSLNKSTYSQAPAIQWQRCYGSTGPEVPNAAAATSDGGAVILGNCGTSNNGDISEASHGGEDFWVLKLDAAGNKDWDKTLGGTFSERGFGIQQTTDGGYIVVGTASSNNTGDVGTNHGGMDYWVVKLNNSGAIVWQKTFGGSGDDQALAVQQTADGGYIVSGESDSSNGDITGAHGNRDYWIIKLDASGNLIWQKALGGSAVDFNAKSIKQTTDGGYIITGGTSSTNGDVSNPNNVVGIAWIVKLNNIGNIEWQKTYGSFNSGEMGVGICQTSDGGYAATGICYQNSGNVTGNHGSSDFWVIKLDAAGNLIWQKSLGGSIQDEPRSIIQSDDGGLVVSGWTVSNNGDVTMNHGNNDYWVVKLSSTGNLLWQKAMGGSGFDQSNAVVQTTDHGYIVAGNSLSNNTGDVGPNHAVGAADFWVVKLAPDIVPVTLSNFNAIAKGMDVLCEWKTMQEQNSSHFIVERSYDAANFNDVGNVTAAGNSSLPVNYNFTDKNALLLNNDYLYYRLKMVDVDGSFKYSNTVKIKIKRPDEISVYPNPVIDQLTLNFTSTTDEKTSVVIYNSTGLKVYEQSLAIIRGANTVNLDIQSLSKGIYFISLKNKKQFFSKFIKLDK